MITEVVEHERLLERAHEIADIVNSNAPLAVRGTRLAILKALDLPLHEAEMLAEAFRERNLHTEDSLEGPEGVRREAHTELAMPMSDTFETILLDVDARRPRRDHHVEPARCSSTRSTARCVRRWPRAWRIVKLDDSVQRGGVARGGRPGVQRRSGHQDALRPAGQRVEPRGSRRTAQPQVAEDVEAGGVRRAGHVHRGRVLLRQRVRRGDLLDGRDVLRLALSAPAWSARSSRSG